MTSLLDCLRPQTPPLPRGARFVQGPAGMSVCAAEAAMRESARPETPKKPKSPGQRGRPRQYESARTDADLQKVVACLRATGAASVAAVERATDIPAPKVRYLLHAARALGMANRRKGGMWAFKEPA